MANRHRGEVEVALGGARYTLRPTFEALCEIEERTGLGLVELARRFWEGRFGVGELAVVLWAGIRAAHGAAPDYERIGRWVVEQGVQDLAGPVARFLAGVIGGGDEDQDQDEDGGDGGGGAAAGAPKKKAWTPSAPPSPGGG